MEWLVSILILPIACALLALWNAGSQKQDFAYRKLDALLSPAERSFYGVLNQAVSDNALIFPKVRVADVLEPAKTGSRRGWWRAFNRISGKHFDFLLCDPEGLTILCAIELDDRSHESPTRKRRDAFLEEACRSSGLPLIRIPARAGYKVPELQALLLKSLTHKPGGLNAAS